MDGLLLGRKTESPEREPVGFAGPHGGPLRKREGGDLITYEGDGHILSAFRPLLCSWLGGLMLALTERESLPEHRTLFLCDEIAQLGRLNAFVTAATLMRGYGLQLWSFWQNMGQLSIYGDQARAILDNAGVVQLFGARNRRMAEEFAAMVGGVDADAIMAMGKDEQLLLLEGGRPHVARRMRYFDDPMFAGLYDATGLRPRNKDSQGHER